MDTPTGLRLDPGPLATDWSRPRRATMPTWAKVAVPVACLVFLASVVWALGGFSLRRYPSIPTAPDATVDLGPLRFTGSAAYAKVNTQEWTVSFPGTCENTTDARLYITDFTDIAFIAAEPVERTVATRTALQTDSADMLNPGPSGCTITASFPPGTAWTGHVYLMLNPLVSVETGATGNSGTRWSPQGSPALILMPLSIVT